MQLWDLGAQDLEIFQRDRLFGCVQSFGSAACAHGSVVLTWSPTRGRVFEPGTGSLVSGEITVAEDFAPPTWPTGDRPQQFHLDVTVDDVEAAEPGVLALGAMKHTVQPGEATDDTFRVYLDPAGHPFCLCWD